MLLRRNREKWEGPMPARGAWPHPAVWRAIVAREFGEGEGWRYRQIPAGPAYYEVLTDTGERTNRYRRTNRPYWWPTISWRQLLRRTTCDSIYQRHYQPNPIKGWI